MPCADTTNTITMLLDIARRFVHKHGGPTNVCASGDRLTHVMEDNECRRFLTDVAASEDSARQLCATALLGLSLAMLVIEFDAEHAEAN